MQRIGGLQHPVLCSAATRRILAQMPANSIRQRVDPFSISRGEKLDPIKSGQFRSREQVAQRVKPGPSCRARQALASGTQCVEPATSTAASSRRATDRLAL